MKQEIKSGGWAWLVIVLAGSITGCTRDPWPLPEVPAGPESAAPAGQGTPNASQLDWSYRGARGPESWAKLDPKWTACGEAGQSPVDLPLDSLAAVGQSSTPAGAKDDSKEAPPDPMTDPLAFLQGVELVAQFADLPLEASNDERFLSLAGAGTQGLSIGGKLAVLQSIEFHLPAEHRLGGTAMDMELVLWLKHPEKGRLALSLLFRAGKENSAMERLIANLPPSGPYESKLLNAMMPLPALMSAGSLLAYVGSESTPPCQTSIPRLVLAQVGEVSPEQLGRLIDVVPALSARPVQPLGDRKVQILTLTSTPLKSSSENRP